MQPPYPPKAGIPFLLNQAFSYWIRTLLYQVLFSLITFSLFFAVAYYASVRYGVLGPYLELSEKLAISMEAYQGGVQEIMKLPGFTTFYWILIGCAVFLFPLNLGLFTLYRKLDNGEKLQVSDLFEGYRGARFFSFASFYLFWIMVYLFTLPTLFLGVFWVLLTLFTAPLMLFAKRRLFETLSLNFTALKRFPLEIIACCLVAILFKYAGMFTIIGAVFTYPFFTAVIYVLYRKIFYES